MNGILLIDKPAGMTSHSVISRLRRKTGIKKMGHVGTLDPSATGLLVVCIGHATKISSFLTISDKMYRTDVCLGKTTTTYDTEGEIVSEKNAEHITKQNILDLLSSFEGEQEQIPPMFSAVKIAGKKLYQYARANQEVDVPSRKVNVESFRLISFSNPLVTLEIACSKGTYVRSLVHDLGQKLGVGASVITIRRLKSGAFTLEHAAKLEDVLEMDLEKITERVVPVSQVLENHFHTVMVEKKDEDLILHGVQFPKSQIADKGFDLNSMFLFVSAETKNEIAIGQWGPADKILIKRVF